MKIILFIAVAILVSFLAFKLLSKSDYSSTEIGNTDNIEGLIKKLMKSTNETAFLRIQIQDTEDFIQFTGDATGVQLNLPLITDRQKSLGPAFSEVGAELDLQVIENEGTDGSKFLDIDINGNETEISNTVQKFIGKLFNANPSTKLVFEFTI